MARKAIERVPAGPFRAFIARELGLIATDDTLRTEGQPAPPLQVLADRFGISEKALRRYRDGLNGNDSPTGVFLRWRVENMLERAGVTFWEVYPELVEDVEIEPDAYCASCREIVTPIAGRCPWCQRATSTKVPERRYCKREDAMRFPANDGCCWRCGGELRRAIPVAPCECGCGRMIARFDLRRGIPTRYALGHGPGPWRSKLSLPAEPFAAWLRSELSNLDPIQALSRRVGLPRDDLLALLGGEIEVVTSTQVNRSLRLAAKEGQLRGTPPRPGSTRIGDLYPDRGGALRCPDCGGPKQRHAQLCRQCRLKAGWNTNQANRPTSMTPTVLAEARRLRADGQTWDEIAQHLQPRTRCTVESVRSGLIAQFTKRGWSTVRGPREGKAA